MDPHRSEKINNPLTYFERIEMITDFLKNSGISSNEFTIIPFPIDHPDSLYNFLPTSIPIYTTINDDWSEHKISLLKKLNYDVRILWEDRHKKYNGMTIRRLILERDERWKTQVPIETVRIIEKYDIYNRLDNLKSA